jgi:feruloyl-CoA synthase
MVSSWGLTESAPAATNCYFQPDRAGVVGLPIPGCALKLVPNGDKLEVRIKGSNVTPGYWKRADLTRAAFDEEGYLRTGDAMRFVDPGRPELGLCFDGRVSEDFKLATGTWVSVGALRLKAIAALEPIARDVVVTGHDRNEIGLLIFPDHEACQRLCEADLANPLALPELLRQDAVRARVRDGLRALVAAGGGTSTYATRALLLVEPPSVDAGEITDKGYINQRAVLTRRACWVDELYARPPSLEVITLTDELRASAPTGRNNAE